MTPWSEYPGKGRATGGVRCHRFLKGEKRLLLAWAGAAPAIAAAPSGSPIELGTTHAGRRDGSGTPVLQPVASVSTRRFGGPSDAASVSPASVGTPESSSTPVSAESPVSAETPDEPVGAFGLSPESPDDDTLF